MAVKVVPAAIPVHEVIAVGEGKKKRPEQSIEKGHWFGIKAV